jgi:hypothetical protein
METRLVEAELFYADRHDEANTRFSQFCECISKEDMKMTLKKISLPICMTYLVQYSHKTVLMQ